MGASAAMEVPRHKKKKMILNKVLMVELEVAKLCDYDEILGTFQHLFNLIKRD